MSHPCLIVRGLFYRILHGPTWETDWASPPSPNSYFLHVCCSYHLLLVLTYTPLSFPHTCINHDPNMPHYIYVGTTIMGRPMAMVRL